MGFFKKKEKDKCPICKNEISLLHSNSIDHGHEVICDDCVNKLRDEFNIESHREFDYRTRNNVRFVTKDDLSSLSLTQARKLIEEIDGRNAQILGDMGDQYANILQIDESFVIAPRPLDVGLARASAMKNKVAVRGSVVKGSFANKDSVVLKNGSIQQNVNINEVHVCDGSDFNQAQNANLCKKPVREGINAWIILDITSGVQPGCTLCK